eukprot:GHVS01052484.1.p1 GENE.GHVS01052484.1~~GHVS01052484.1.p1  ORF type:complete len:174 (+),score=18.15 GHVS01052484.1:185-706(+)
MVGASSGQSNPGAQTKSPASVPQLGKPRIEAAAASPMEAATPTEDRGFDPIAGPVVETRSAALHTAGSQDNSNRVSANSLHVGAVGPREAGMTSSFEHPLQLRIPRADCVGGTFGRHTEYIVELNDTGETFTVARRFRTFLELHQQITEELFGTGDVPEVGWASEVLGGAGYH